MTYGWDTSTYELHRDEIRVHASDIQTTYEYIQLRYGWPMSTNEWHANDIRVHTSDILLSTSPYEWRTYDIQVHASDIRMTSTYHSHTNDIRIHSNTCEYKKMTYVQYNDALVSVQYNAVLAIIGAIQSIFKERCIKN